MIDIALNRHGRTVAAPDLQVRVSHLTIFIAMIPSGAPSSLRGAAVHNLHKVIVAIVLVFNLPLITAVSVLLELEGAPLVIFCPFIRTACTACVHQPVFTVGL